MKEIANEIWVIFDPLDGPHIFRSKAGAEAQYEQWRRAAGGVPHDSFWDMSKPVRYVLDQEADK